MKQTRKQSNPFDSFTNLYSLSKTLRFSLIPVLTEEQENKIINDKKYQDKNDIRNQDRIEMFFNENKADVFEVDIERKKRYKALKYYLTELHKLFIKDILSKVKEDASTDFSKLFKSYKEFEVRKDDNQKKLIAKDINDEKARLGKSFGNKEGKGGVFQQIAEQYYDWLIKNLNDGEKVLDDKDKKQRKNNILLSQNALLILNKRIKDGSIQEKEGNDKSNQNKYALRFEDTEKGEPTTLVEYFSGWSTYFKNFNEIRGNLYKDVGRKEEEDESEGETKIRKANAGQLTTRILDENFEIFIRNAVWAEKNKVNLSLQNFQEKDIVNRVSIFDHHFYIYCLLQTDINNYNAKIAELNKLFNENKKKNQEVKFLKPLHKQLLLTDKMEEDTFVEEFLDDEDFIKGLEDFKLHSQAKINIVKGFDITKLEENLDDVTFDENQTHFFCNKYFGSWSYLRNLYYHYNDIEDKNQSKKEDELRDTEGTSKTDISLSEIKTLLDKEKKEDFLEAVKNGWFCRDFKGFSDVSPLKDAGIYKDNVSNFENFVSFLQFDITSLLNGRKFLSRKEIEDKKKIEETKKYLQEKRSEGEKIDDLLLSKFSEDTFIKNLAEDIETKQTSFKHAFKELKDSVENKEKITRERDFECKKAINEYCTRVSDINNFFALFSAPEGIISDSINNIVQKFKHDNRIIPLFNAIRNYITRRTEETEKIKLNFDNPLLLGGWAYKTTDYNCRILEKDNKYYLLIIGSRRQDDDPIKEFLSEFQIMNYYQQKGQTIFGSVYKGKFDSDYDADRSRLSNADFIKNIELIVEDLAVFFPKVKEKLTLIKNMSRSNKFDFGISKDGFLQLFKEKTGRDFSEYRDNNAILKKADIIIDILKKPFGNDRFDYQKDQNYLVKRIKDIIKKNAGKTNFIGSDRLVYEITKLEPYFYENSFRPVDFEDKDSVLNNKSLFLFQIYCKDFSPKRGINVENPAKDLQTLYFEELFSKTNQENPIFKLSGGAEVFFREKIDDYKIEQWERKELKQPKTDKIPNKSRRFTQNQILFHVSIELNNINGGGNINRKIQEYIRENQDIKILGIDRGEKELAYYCLLDKDGKICGEPKSMNVVGSNIIKDDNGQERKQAINYRQKLDIKEKERMMARRSWTKIEGIRNLKEGYISNVINEIAKLMIDNDNKTLRALVCLEELNHGFKRDRSIRIEKGVYQRMENALVDKLSYMVLEKTSEGVRNALQLTPENRAIKYWGNQMGAIFYTDAKFTSKTCPHCGFRRRGIGEMKTAKQIKEKIENGELKVFFEKNRDRFRIEYSWKVEAFQFSCDDLYGKGKMETIYSDVERSSWNGDTLKKDIFKDYLRDDVELFALVKDSPGFRFTDFGRVFNSLVWLRHNVEKNGKEYDYISCPKCHFSTMHPKVKKIINGDANGAYNIARRGLMIFEKIRSVKLRKKIDTEDDNKLPTTLRSGF